MFASSNSSGMLLLLQSCCLHLSDDSLYFNYTYFIHTDIVFSYVFVNDFNI